MSTSIGTLTIEMAADIGRLTSDMNQAKSIVKSSMADIQQAVAAAQKVFITLTGVAGVSMFKDMVLGSIEAMAKLRALSVQSGMTVESLSGLAAVGRSTGTGADAIAAASNKFSKALATANEDSKGAATALKALGLSFDDFQRMAPEERIKKVADAMSQFKDGGQKSAAAMLLFGKSGAEMLPFLKDLAATGEIHAKVTTEQAEQAHHFEVQMGKLKVQSEAWKKTLAIEVLPTLIDISDAILQVKKSSGDAGTVIGEGLVVALQTVAVLGLNLVYVFKQVGTEIGGLAAQFVQFISGNFSGAGAIGDAMKIDAKNARIEIDKLEASILGLNKFNPNDSIDAQSRRMARPKPEIKGLNGDGTGGLKDDATKKILEGKLKALEEFIGAEKTQMQTRQQYLDFYRGLEYFTLRETEEKKQSLIADNLRFSAATYDKEIAVIQAYISQAAKVTDREDGRNRLSEARKRRAAVEIEANKLIGDSQNTLMAIQRQFNLATIEGARTDGIANASAQFQIDMLGKNTLEVLKATEARKIQLALEERIFQLQKLDKNADTSGAIAQAATQTAIATAKIEESYNKQRTAVFGADEAVRKYLEDIGNQAVGMERMYSNAFKGMEDALVSFVKTGKLDFKSLADNIISDMIRMQIQQSVMKPFTQSFQSSGGGLGGIISGINSVFGGGSAPLAGSGVTIGGLDGMNGYATGGDPPVGVPYLVGEKGPELRMDRTPSTIIPNNKLGGLGGRSVNLTNNITVAGGISAAESFQAIQRALTENNRQWSEQLKRQGVLA